MVDSGVMLSEGFREDLFFLSSSGCQQSIAFLASQHYNSNLCLHLNMTFFFGVSVSKFLLRRTSVIGLGPILTQYGLTVTDYILHITSLHPLSDARVTLASLWWETHSLLLLVTCCSRASLTQ